MQWFTDFSEYPVSTELSEHDWSKPWAQGPQAMVRVEDGESLVHVTNPGSNARTAWTWDSIGSLTTADYPIQVRAEISFSSLVQSNELQAHVSGGSGSENAYIATRVTTRQIVRYSNGVSSSLVTASFSHSLGTRFHLLLEIHSSGVRHKIWPADSSEPASWLLVSPDTELTSGGVGLGAASADTDFRCYWFSVGTEGDPAPDEPVQPDPPTEAEIALTLPAYSLNATASVGLPPTAEISLTLPAYQVSAAARVAADIYAAVGLALPTYQMAAHGIIYGDPVPFHVQPRPSVSQFAVADGLSADGGVHARPSAAGFNVRPGIRVYREDA